MVGRDVGSLASGDFNVCLISKKDIFTIFIYSIRDYVNGVCEEKRKRELTVK